MLHELIYTNIIPIDSIGPGYKPCDQLTDCTQPPINAYTNKHFWIFAEH